MSTLVEQAQRHIERQMAELSGDEDFLPFMTLRNAKDEVIYIGIVMPDSGSPRDYVADMMTAMCMVHRPVEVTFASITWMVSMKTDGQSPADMEAARAKMNQLPPSRHPDRVETAFLVDVDAEGKCMIHSANVIRENNMVGVGLWTDGHQGLHIAGRFGEAIQHGIALGQKLPPELCDYIDEEEAAGRMQELVMRTMRMITEVRKGVEE